MVNTEKVQKAIELLLDGIGEKPGREGLKGTPDRVARSFEELVAGYAVNPKAILSKDFDSEGYDEMICLRQVDFFSLCEHHMLPFFGTATVAYIPGGPKGRVVGLSKLARLVECFARRLQIQERMTQEISKALIENVDPRGVGVVVKARHFCMVARGVQKQNAEMITSSLAGLIKDDPKARQEFIKLAGI